jgi:hypothetical protein
MVSPLPVAFILAASPDPVALGTEHLVNATWFLAQVTVGLAFATVLAVAAPIVLRYVDLARETRASRRQMISILHLLEARVKMLIVGPLISADRLIAATENLMNRALEADMARALPPNKVNGTYLAVVKTFQTIHEARSLQDYYREQRATIRRLEREERAALESGDSEAAGAIKARLVGARETAHLVATGISYNARTSQEKLVEARAALGDYIQQDPGKPSPSVEDIAERAHRRSPHRPFEGETKPAKAPDDDLCNDWTHRFAEHIGKQLDDETVYVAVIQGRSPFAAIVLSNGFGGSVRLSPSRCIDVTAVKRDDGAGIRTAFEIDSDPRDSAEAIAGALQIAPQFSVPNQDDVNRILIESLGLD